MKFKTHALLFLFVLPLIFFYSCSDDDETQPDDFRTFTVKTFQDKRHAFGDGLSHRFEETFHFDTDPTRVERIRMFVKLRCPQQGCNAWDMYANVKVKHPQTGHWLEIGRYITPYGVDNAALPRGFVIDVTDFKELLTGDVELMSFVEVWGNDGWLVSIEFDIIEGNPEYKYVAVAPVLDYAEWSLAGVPYGEEHDFELQRNVTVPSNAEQTVLRTIITGWGHATPADPDGRRCAEWCFRSHDVLINGEVAFTHDLDPIGCADNPVQPQNGNWAPDRAGWCPGMQVPVRRDIFPEPLYGESFTFEYQFEEWTNNFQSGASNPHAYYAISTFVVVKSNEPIEAPVVE